MSDLEKLDKAKKINDLLSSFVEKIEQENSNTNTSSQFLKGYQQCLVDLLSDIDAKNESTLSMLITAKIEHKTKAAIYEDLLSSLNAINKGFNRVLEEWEDALK